MPMILWPVCERKKKASRANTVQLHIEGHFCLTSLCIACTLSMNMNMRGKQAVMGISSRQTEVELGSRLLGGDE